MPGSAVVKHDHSRVTACACHASSRTTRTDDTGRLPFITCVVIVGRVLQSFRDRDTERVWRRQRSKRFDQPTQRAALRKLLIMDAADQIGDLRVPPGNRLEKLKGDRASTDSIRNNDQWRRCFRWTRSGQEDAEKR